MREEILALARRQIGYTEGADNDTLYGKAYGLNHNPWCQMFVWWCADQCGAGADIVPKTAHCPTAAAWFKARGLWHERGAYAPRAADLVYFNYDGGSVDHVGFVETYTETLLTTIEGNAGDAVRRNTYAPSSGVIAGYASPAYEQDEAADETAEAAASSAEAVRALQRALNAQFAANLAVDGAVGPLTRAAMRRCLLIQGSRGEAVGWAQSRLIASGLTCGAPGADGVFGPLTRAAVVAFQRARNLTADGVIGIETYGALLKD